MRALLQRVLRASVTVEGATVGQIGPGLVVFLGVEIGDTDADARYLAEKVAGLRIFGDEASKFNLSARDSNSQILVVSQFTLLADARKGRRPSFTEAAPPEIAEPLLEKFVQCVRATGLEVATGRFRKHMLVEIHNDGPVTVPLDSRHKSRQTKAAADAS